MLIHRIAAQLYTAEALQDIEAALAAGEDAPLAISQSGPTLAVAAQFARTPPPPVYLVSGVEGADRAARSLAAYVGVEHVARFPERKDYPWKSNEPDDAVVAARCAAMSRVAQGESCIMVASEKEPLKTEPDLLKILPREYWNDVNHQWSMLGREICDARKPLCGECPLADICPSAKLG